MFNITITATYLLGKTETVEKVMLYTRPSGPCNRNAEPVLPERLKMLYKNAPCHITRKRPNHLCVEPVLRAVLDSKGTLGSIACLWRNASCGVYSVNLLVVTLDGLQLQPRDAAEAIGTLAGIQWGCALDLIGLCLDISVVDLVGLELEQGDLLLGELVVARQTRLGFGRCGDGVVKSQASHVGEDLDVEACSIARGIEERGNCASCDGDVVAGG